MANKKNVDSKMIRNNLILLIFITFIILMFTIPCFGSDSKLQLTPEEKAWIDKSHTVRVRIGSAPPFMLTDGKVRGIAIDYLTSVFNRNGIKFSYVQESEVTWPQALKYIEQHDVVDMVPTAKITGERKKHMLFTNEYIVAPWVIFTRSDADFVSSIDDLKGKTVSVEEGFVIHGLLKREYPEINLKVASAKLENNFAEIPIRDLSTGVVNAYIGNLIMTTYMIQSKGYTNVKVAAPTPFDNHNQAMAIRNDWPELVSIINKTIAAMTPEEHTAIRNKWLSIKYEYGIKKADIIRWVLSVTAIASLLIGVVLFWNKRLKVEINSRTKVEKTLKQLLETFELAQKMAKIGHWRYNIETQQPIWSEQMFMVLGCDPDKGVPNYEAHKKIFHPDDWEMFDKAVQGAINGIPYNIEARIIFSDGSIHWCNAQGFPHYDQDGNVVELFGTTQDITDRRKAEAAMRESEERFRTLFENAPLGYQSLDAHGDLIEINETWCKLLGYTKSEVYGKNFSEFIHPDFRKIFKENFPKFKKMGYILGIEFEMIKKDGSEIIVAFDGRIGHEDDGSFKQTHCVLSDITDRKQAEEALRKSEEKYRDIFEKGSDILYLHDMEGNFIETNLALKREYGWDGDNFDIVNVKDLMPNLHKPLFDDYLKRVTENGKDEGLMCITVKDGRERIIEYLNSLVYDPHGIPFGVQGSARDVTDRISAEKKLKDSETLKNTIIESSPDCIKLLDLEGNLMYMSNGGQEKLEIKDINIYLNKCWIDFWQGKDNTNARMAVDTAVKGGIGKFRGYSPTETGKPRWWDVIITPILGSKGEVEQVLAVSRDITEQKQMEDNLRQAQKMESIGTLTGGIAHDFNNILGIIVGNTELALDDVPEWNPAHESIKEIKTASLRATKIVKQLLSFSRKTDQKLQPIEIGIVIKDALKFLRSTIPSTVNIHQDIQTTDETILADSTQINQIMMNLCINASHAMEQTGGDLTITAEKIILDYKSLKNYPDLKNGKHVKITVSDTGPGIDPEIIDRIFDPYFTTKEMGKGSGMGLAVVHGIVNNHNGTITVDSSLGKGTTFSIFFPLVAEKPKIETQTTQELFKGSETILFVDDEISITKMVKRMFERLGYKVETATAPQDALDRFRLNPEHFDLVITDMTMPQMTGVKLSEKLMDIRPDIPIIICTGHSALVDEERAKDLGLAAYVMKPIDIQETAQTIRKVLDKK